MVIRNFLFHRVSDEKDRMWPPMSTALFERIISHLTRNFSVVPLEHFLADPAAFKTDRPLATVLFDDGFRDNIEYAAPLLAKYKCPASFYIVTGCIDRNIPTWTYRIDTALSGTQKKQITLSPGFIPAKFRSIRVDGPLARELKPWMKSLSNTQRIQVMEAVLKECDDVAESKVMMDWNDIRELQNRGFIIGSHSDSHPMLASLQDEDEIVAELKVSGERIKKETGNFPLTISYPIGSYDERVIRIAKEQGYRYGLAVQQRFYKTGKDTFFEIPRVELYQEPWWKVKMRITGLYSRIKKVWP